jgi:hypothetical protein
VPVRRSGAKEGRRVLNGKPAAPSTRVTGYFFFFPFDLLEPDGITLATVLTIELAIFATTPFLDLAFALGFAFAFGFVCALGALLVFVRGLVVAAFFAIADSAISYPLQITLN